MKGNARLSPLDQALAALGTHELEAERISGEIELMKFLYQRRTPADDEADRDRRAKIARHARTIAKLLKKEDGDLLNGLQAELAVLARYVEIKNEPATLKSADALGGPEAVCKILQDGQSAFASVFQAIARNAERGRHRRGKARETALILEAARMFDFWAPVANIYARPHHPRLHGVSRGAFIRAVLDHCGVKSTPGAIAKALERNRQISPQNLF
jgi:hypothetical protein